jgi:GTP-binding protein Era
MAFRSGFVSIIGRPNAGKSTLLNALLGQRLAIVTHKPQTTRTRIHGVLEVPLKKKSGSKKMGGEAGHPAAQVVLVDTPGVHKPETQLDRRMMAMSAAEDDFALELVKRLDCPVVLVLNKIDAVRKEDLLPLIAHWSALHTFADVVPISARKKEGLALLLDKIVALLPEGQRYFPRDQVTDQPERFLAAELIREKILLLTGEEVPYATAVVIEKYEEPASMKKMKYGKLPVTKIAAAIFCERTGQKAILIGKQGAMLKQIGTAARKDIEGLLGTRVFLELFVKVQEEWRSSRGFVEELDWRRQLAEMAAKQAVKE